jgi:hypothetical protein
MFPLKYGITLSEITDDSSEKLHENQFIPSQNRWTATFNAFSSRVNFTHHFNSADVQLGKMTLFLCQK